MNNVSAELLGGIVYASDAHLVWEDLRERFDKVNRVRNFQLHREIATLSQGTNSVSVYFSRIKELWHEYDVLVPFSDCGCRKARDHVEQMHQQRVMQFLSGLNDSYDQSRRQILMKTNAPNLNQTYAMIIQDESQQSIGATVLLDKMDPIAMQAGRDLYSGRVKGIGRERGGLYILKENSDVNRLARIRAVAVSNYSEEGNLWNMRLGHPSVTTMNHIEDLRNKVSRTIQNDCPVCPLVKQSRLQFPVSSSRADLPFNLSSCPYTPQQNDVVERKHRHILDVARDLRFQASIPIRYRGMCVQAAVYLINGLPSRVLNGKVPYEMLYQKKPTLGHIRVLGCLCYAKRLVKGDKFAQRANATVLLGFSETQKGYILLDLSSNLFFVSRDVVFKGSIFPFKQKYVVLPSV
uniref:Retrotransposon gag domain-containing protein n=1 Tax=Nicotiana tabacum TaxID=4097 RepID=A0A1S3ZCL3_TOBAC|nr:PREDICTED: uncharacterized protein LOC107785231 [Nicotiana tabacum]